ncbi:MAG: hypothetical protein DRI34_07860 [Deltaproteobacteria bacterium]|nr:MAG: hypothetical protein DRI34_07860 [Deltaproteobacteria bacterium]
MSAADTLMANRKASQIFFHLVRRPAGLQALARRVQLKPAECRKLLERMSRAGLIGLENRSYRVDWEGFLPLFVTRSMNIYSLAMPWKFIASYMDQGEKDVVAAACARAEREMAQIKVKLAGNDVFFDLVRSYFEILVTEAWAPSDYLEDMRITDAIDEFEIALLKLLPLMRRGRRPSAQHRELYRMLHQWYKQLQGYDTPLGAALRAAFEQQGLLS